MTTIPLTSQRQRDYAKAMIDSAPDGAFVTVGDKAAARTTQQNKLLHDWFTQIGRHLGEEMLDVKVQCNLTYGRPILARDNPDWASAYGYFFEHLNYAAKVKAIRVFDIPFTRNMTVKQLSEYMDAMQRDYRAEGVRLTDPEAMKYEGMK